MVDLKKAGEPYTCGICKEEFIREIDDSASIAQMKENFPVAVAIDELAGEDPGIMCDECYNRFLKWLSQEQAKQ
jgi:DNA-directed RNA polymerase subunit RPC12/RpoP